MMQDCWDLLAMDSDVLHVYTSFPLYIYSKLLLFFFIPTLLMLTIEWGLILDRLLLGDRGLGRTPFLVNAVSLTFQFLNCNTGFFREATGLFIPHLDIDNFFSNKIYNTKSLIY